ncbi:MAG TPA: histidine phosphatase family protein [Paludibacteraceae bacterium]|nr:histidine phosphatase family protein [Paludibacteraceae bacterium]HOU67482.1 histidine phosphatase family protein [Paludibacteraceae bacterium]HPH62598.1 histidine phosphatase family protein [Paludibacteraceae bacterium]HQF49575.1 histidine phosphatase family protein [Paludibacteraceae bacterium]HQJ89199.1 histidine phosphatase family protein [Paludibacteraceae bacterium]
MTRIYFTRHGQTFWNVERRMQGQSNSDLTPLGVKQAIALGQRLKDTELDVIYSSSLSRSMRTAELIRGKRKLDIIPEDDFREIDLGEWQGKLMSEVEKQEPEMVDNFWNHPELFIRPNAETYLQLRERAGKKLEEIVAANKGKKILIVTHGVVLKTLHSFFQYQPISEIARYPKSPLSTSLNIVEKENGIWNILMWNDTSHYDLIK